MTFSDLFQAATGYEPHGYQARVARDGLPDVVEAPTGTGKTGVILAWLWRRLHGPDPREHAAAAGVCVAAAEPGGAGCGECRRVAGQPRIVRTGSPACRD